MKDEPLLDRISGWLLKGHRGNPSEKTEASSGDLSDTRRKKSNRKVTLLLILGVVGILLILLSECGGKQESGTTLEVSPKETDVEEVEQRLRDLVATISGDQSPQVMVSFSDTGESLYEYDTQTSSEESVRQGEEQSSKQTSQQNVIYVEDENGMQQALVRQYRLAKPEGVVVACQGGENITVKSRLVQAISTLFGISTDKVYITERVTDP